jgi:hypothetical protein
MTVFSLRRLAARPLRRAAMICHPPRECRRVPPGRRTYHDWFFADPAAVEDDYHRMRRRTTSGRR